MGIKVKKDGQEIQLKPGAPEPEPNIAEIIDHGKKKAAKSLVDTSTLSMEEILAVVRKDKGDAIAVTARTIPDVARVPTGVFEFDMNTGGGFPQGRISLVYGVESSGKTNICYKAIAYVQRYFPESCNKCVFVDLEGTFDPLWAQDMGVDIDKLIVLKPAYGEEAVDVTDAFVRASDVALLIADSLAVLVSSSEINKSVETADIGSSAMLVKRLCNKIVIGLGMEGRKKHTPAIILINQRRFKPNVRFGDPETIPGGEAQKFLASLIVRLYGKNENDPKIHPDKPVWKHTSAIIKKAKIPVRASSFEYKMAMVQADDIDIGDTDSWNTVAGHLKAQGKLEKTKGGWTVFGEEYKTLVPIREQYVCDLGFRVKCQQEVIKGMESFLVAEASSEAPPKEDGDDGSGMMFQGGKPS